VATRRGPPTWLFLLLATAAVAAAWILAFGPDRRSRSTAPPSSEPDFPAPSVPSGWAPRPVPVPTVVPEGCEPHASTACLRGDAWWLDSCGNPHELAEECGLRPCSEGACEADDPQCAAGPVFGTCDGDVARGCTAGRWYEVDCSAYDKRCVMGEEGPECRTVEGFVCNARAVRPRCEGNELVACIEGEEQRIDCAASGALCMPTRGGAWMGCVRWGPAAPGDECGACGCPPSPEAEELCDGRDNDGDGFIDENVDCGEVVLLPIVIADDDGDTAYTEADLDAELQRINRAFARDDDHGLQFRLDEPIWLAKEDWLELDDTEVQGLLAGSAIAYERPHFYIPIVFTDVVLVDGVPRPGLATPPNGSCGGQRRIRDPQPALGAVVIATRRWPTTVAHEIGHYLGLCHTHMPAVDAVEVRAGSPDDPDAAVACAEPCAFEDDGICDTPPDPGPEVCAVDPECGPICGDGSVPDPGNIMGYYPDCRSLFTQEQALLMRRALALRRGWWACMFGDGCSCDPILADCPEQMTCAPFGAVDAPDWKCRLDGARVPGATCMGAGECGLGSICVGTGDGGKRCVRACNPFAAACECREVPGLLTPVCVDDLG
jgi:hypothetical protein